jgi:hypothetical protein
MGLRLTKYWGSCGRCLVKIAQYHSVLHEIPRKQSQDHEQPERRPQSSGFAVMLGLEDRVVEEPPRDDFLTLRLQPR